MLTSHASTMRIDTMKSFLDHLPVLIFFPVYLWQGMLPATAAAIVAAAVQLTWMAISKQKPQAMQIISIAAIVLFGGITLLLQDKQFFMWKPTIINILFAAGFLGFSWVFGQPAVQKLLGSQIPLPDAAWQRLNWMWIMYFLVGALANWLVAQRFFHAEQTLITASPELDHDTINQLDCPSFASQVQPLCENAQAAEQFWVNFKLFGLIGLTLVFIVIQGVYISRYLSADETNEKAHEKNL